MQFESALAGTHTLDSISTPIYVDSDDYYNNNYLLFNLKSIGVGGSVLSICR